MIRTSQALLLAGAFLVCALLACSSTLEIQVIDYQSGAGLTPKDSDCEMVLYGENQPIPAGCIPVGDAFVGDTGGSSNCGYSRVKREMRKQACSFGADAARVVRHHKPSFFGSSCHQLRAQFLRCPQEGEAL